MSFRKILGAFSTACLLLGFVACGQRTLDSGLTLYPVPARDTISFWGHACCYIDVGGFGILTDPVFECSSHWLLRRKVPAPAPSAYADARLILISHAHADHLSPVTLAGMPPEAVILCSESVAEHIGELSLKIVPVRIWDEWEFPGGRVVAVPADHPSGRYTWHKGDEGGALGFVIQTPQTTIYWSGDTSFFRGMEEIGDRYRTDLAILNINSHLQEEDVLRCVAALRTTRVMPIHHGAYGVLFFPQRKGPRDPKLLRRWLGPLLLELELGESVPLAGISTIKKQGSPERALRDR